MSHYDDGPHQYGSYWHDQAKRQDYKFDADNDVRPVIEFVLDPERDIASQILEQTEEYKRLQSIEKLNKKMRAHNLDKELRAKKRLAYTKAFTTVQERYGNTQ